jgi:hypothetical protein
LAKDRTPVDGAAKSGKAGRAGASRSGKGGRTRPPANVVAPQRPWGLIAAAVAVVVFAVAVIGYAVVQVNKANAGRVESIDEIAGVETYRYETAQHVPFTVAYAESPPVGGEHDAVWADCTGTVYDVDIRHENAVHSLEHGAVWITYDPEELSDDEIATLAELVDGKSGRMLSPYVGLDSPVSLQAWNHQLKVDSVDDPRVEQFADFLTRNPDFSPEPGATCESSDFLAEPRIASGAGSPAAGETDAPAETGSPAETAAP